MHQKGRSRRDFGPGVPGATKGPRPTSKDLFLHGEFFLSLQELQNLTSYPVVES